ncbi:MAG: M14 family zinc carboxypeptidase, partial [Pseudomonadota bacterium]
MFARFLIAIAVVILSGVQALAQEPYSPEPLETLLATNVSYAADIPTPADVTGYEVGEIILPHELMVQYVRAIDRASDRVKIEQIAQSHLKRPIFAVYVSSPDNLQRLDDIKESRSAVLQGRSPAIEIGVHQINYGVHGSEPSSYDSAPLMLYHLAAAQDSETRALLDDNLIILMVTLNPDGASRMANWVNSHRAEVPVAYPAHKERGVFFAGGRTNHYMFDLNRQWLPVA